MESLPLPGGRPAARHSALSTLAVMYLKGALEQRSVSIPYTALLRRLARVDEYVRTLRRFVRARRDLITSLKNWRPTILLLCWLQGPVSALRTGLDHARA